MTITFTLRVPTNSQYIGFDVTTQETDNITYADFYPSAVKTAAQLLKAIGIQFYASYDSSTSIAYREPIDGGHAFLVQNIGNFLLPR